MMRDVFADIGDGSGGTHDNFCLGFLGRLLGRGVRIFRGFRFFGRVALRRKLHYPAAGIFPRGGELNRVALLQHFERGVPEF